VNDSIPAVFRSPFLAGFVKFGSKNIVIDDKFSRISDDKSNSSEFANLKRYSMIAYGYKQDYYDSFS